MSNPFQDALPGIRGDSRAARAARSSLRAASSKFHPTAPEPLLTVELAGRQQIGAWDAAQMSIALQSATAKLAHVITDPTHERVQTRRADREAALLLPRAQVGRTMYFAFPSPPSAGESSLFPDLHIPSLSESAALELCEILPSSDQDDAALDALLGQRTTVRSAITDIVEALNETSLGIELRLATSDRIAVHSQVSVEQASLLRDSLRETRTDRRVEEMTGRLDGVRTRRRIFYLELETGEEVWGAIGPEPELMEAITQHLDQRVIATVESERVEQLSGRRSRPAYRLVSLTEQPGLPGM